MNFENSKTSDPQRLLLNLTDKIDLRIKYKSYCFLKSWYLQYMEKYKKFIKNNKSKISAPTWNEEFELPDASYSISDI